MPCIGTTSRVLALCTILGALDDTEYPSRCLALYLLGPSRRRPVPRALGNLYLSAEIAPPSYQMVDCTPFLLNREELNRMVPDLMVRDKPPARIVEEVCLTRITADERVQKSAFSGDCLVSCRLPAPVDGFE